MSKRFRSTVGAAIATAVAVLGFGCGGTDEPSAGGGDGEKLSLVAYSTPREAYEELIPMFQATADGTGVTFDQSYASSGEQSRAVDAGLPADVVAFSLEPDVTRLVEAGLVDENWSADEFNGMVSESVVVFAVREGNPKNIRTWNDLLRTDVEVITPNPFTSGGAQWNLMAAFGAQLELGQSEVQAVQYLRDLLANVPVQDKSARESLQTFSGGKGDVLLAYENEAIFAKKAGESLDYVVPDQTILIENPIAVTTDAPEVARSFVEFVRTPDAQRVFGEHGYRSIRDDILAEFDFPTPASLFTIADLGGWSKVRSKFFDRENGIVADINKQLGVPTDDR